MQKLIPFFAGTTESGDTIILYRRGTEIHIQRPDGELWAIEPGAVMERWEDNERSTAHVKIVSSVWTGEASGTRKDLMEVLEK